ncbi:MAG: DegT/DnrJ/EryC1/StrS family aminotransferase [Euryarchaeota archaeon]|nr:DegT/DnrJ/EryC1/StrS family aminotransferase [Euryarchaeota archaeon]
MTEKLAIFGGKPIRSKDFPKNAVIDQKEIDSILDVFKNKEFSRYAGGPSFDVEKLLRMKSLDAVKYKALYWNFLGGNKVKKFEADFSKYFGVDYSICINSATSGLSVALASADVSVGDEVITTCLSFTANATSILMFNSIPVFVDVDPRTFCIDPKEIEKAITPRTRAIVVVHLLGNAADMDEIMKIAKKHNLIVIEDCAQSPGVKYKGKYVGTIGDFGVFSFQETKNMMTGEGGMIVTNNPAFARKCRLIRNHGETVLNDDSPLDDLVNCIGYNLRMTELTAALGIEQLKKLKKLNQARNTNAQYLRKNISKFPGLSFTFIPDDVEYVSHVFPILYDEKKTGVPRDVFVKALKMEGIPVSTGYLRLLYEHPLFQKRIAYGKVGCPFTCPFYKGKIDYTKLKCNVAEDLIYRKFIWIYHVYNPATINDMKDIINSIEKIYSNLDELKKIKREEIKIDYAR